MTPYDAADPATHPRLDGWYKVRINDNEREALWQGRWFIYQDAKFKDTEVTHYAENTQRY